MSKDTSAPAASPVTSTEAEVDLIPHFISADGKRQAKARWLPGPAPETGVRYAVWQADPGTYTSPGGNYVETFVVTHGTGELTIQGVGEYPIQPGSIVTIPPNTSSTIATPDRFRKFATFEDLSKSVS